MTDKKAPPVNTTDALIRGSVTTPPTTREANIINVAGDYYIKCEAHEEVVRRATKEREEAVREGARLELEMLLFENLPESVKFIIQGRINALTPPEKTTSDKPVDMKTTKPEEWKLSVPHVRDLHGVGFVEAICAHGIGHHRGMHGCDGCCSTMPNEIKSQTTKDND